MGGGISGEGRPVASSSARAGRAVPALIGAVLIGGLVVAAALTAAGPGPDRKPSAITMPQAERDLCSGVGSIMNESPVSDQHGEITPVHLDDSMLDPGSPWQTDFDLAQDLTAAAQNHGDSPPEPWEAALAGHGFIRGWIRGWSYGDTAYETDTLMSQVLEFESAAQAQAFQRQITVSTCTTSLDVFEVPGLPGAVGLRFLFDGASEPRVTDQVTFVVGKRRYIVALGRPGAEPNRQQLFDLAREAHSKATAPGDLCATLSGAFDDVAMFAQEGESGPIQDLSSVVVGTTPAGFELLLEGEEEDRNGTHAVPVYRRVWKKETGGSMDLSVTQYGTPRVALRELRSNARSMCQQSNSVTIPDEMRGTLVFTQVQENEVMRFAYFARGPRVYRVFQMGTGDLAPVKELNEFTLGAMQLAR